MCNNNENAIHKNNVNTLKWFKRLKRKDIYSFLIWFSITVILLICFLFESSKWVDTEYITVSYGMLVMGGLLSVITIGCLFILMFFRRQPMEGKFLVVLGFVSVALGTLGLSNQVFENRMTFLDTLYKSIQFFAGEFDVNLNGKPIPIILNVARFLALFVSAGTIVVVLLKQKLRYLKIRLFYKDVVIISDKPEGHVMDLASNLIKAKKKVVIGYTSEYTVTTQRRDGVIPIISVKADDFNKQGLIACNVHKAKVIYLLCKRTEENVKLAKSIYSLLHKSKKSKINFKRHIKNIFMWIQLWLKRLLHRANNETVSDNSNQKKEKSINDMIKEYIKIINNIENEEDSANKEKEKSDKTVCYIQYLDDEERDYYSIDKVFNNRTDSFDTYFINPYDISIRQMIARSSITNSLNINEEITSDELEKQLNKIKIAVSGSGKLLKRTLMEIAKNCVYNNITPIEIYYITHNESNTINEKSIVLNQLSEIINLKIRSVNEFTKEFNESNESINLFFISSTDEKGIRRMLQSVFQYDLQNKIHEYMLLTDGNDVEYDILKTYIKSLLSPYFNGDKVLINSSINPTLYLSRVTDLMLTMNQFYINNGPKGEEIHNAYKSAFKNEELKNFSNLPEIYRDSNTLGALHNEFVIDIIDEIIIGYLEIEKIIDLEEIKEHFNYLSSTEHERWYNERHLQGYILSTEKSVLYNKNPNLKHWNDLDEEQRYENLKYFIKTLIAQRKKVESHITNKNIYKELILEYKFNKNNENERMEECI